jgi:hypothetical protein
MLYATPQLLDQYIWVPVRDTFVRCCGHLGMEALDGLLAEPEPPLVMREAAEHGLPLYRALDPAGSVPGDWRDRAVQAGRPSALLRREALAAREAAALQAPAYPPAQVSISLTFLLSSLYPLN